jgi:hypothetical protein
VDKHLRCRSFRSYTGKLKPRCNAGDSCVACNLLHFLVWLIPEMDVEEARKNVIDYIRSNP